MAKFKVKISVDKYKRPDRFVEVEAPSEVAAEEIVKKEHLKEDEGIEYTQEVKWLRLVAGECEACLKKFIQ